MIARISQLHKTEAEWRKLLTWVPAAGEIVVYDPDKHFSYARIKIGDGERALQELPFFIDSAIYTYLQNLRHPEVIDGGCLDEPIDESLI